MTSLFEEFRIVYGHDDCKDSKSIIEILNIIMYRLRPFIDSTNIGVEGYDDF